MRLNRNPHVKKLRNMRSELFEKDRTWKRTQTRLAAAKSHVTYWEQSKRIGWKTYNPIKSIGLKLAQRRVRTEEQALTAIDEAVKQLQSNAKTRAEVMEAHRASQSWKGILKKNRPKAAQRHETSADRSDRLRKHYLHVIELGDRVLKSHQPPQQPAKRSAKPPTPAPKAPPTGKGKRKP